MGVAGAWIGAMINTTRVNADVRIYCSEYAFQY